MNEAILIFSCVTHFCTFFIFIAGCTGNKINEYKDYKDEVVNKINEIKKIVNE